jgi:hypothetical protein
MTRRTWITLLVLAAAASSCSKGQQKLVAPAPEPPLATSPIEAVRTVESAWKTRADGSLPHLYTEDFEFAFAPGDSAGNPYTNHCWQLEDEVLSSSNCFANASEITLSFQRNLVPLNDDRPGKNATWHKYILTHVDLRVILDRGNGPELNEVHGYAKFYLVRGDSAQLTANEMAAGGTDSTRWWVQRWEDETLSEFAEAMRTNPTQNQTWGNIKNLFRNYPTQ